MKRIAIYHLETLLWIARLGTFAAAAERLNTTQPAISARVREIEGQLGVSLFRREGRRMVFSPAGRQLVRECEPLWAGLESALLGVSGFAGARGVVRLGAGEIAAASCLPDFAAGIERDLPGVTLEIELDLTARMLQHLLGGTSDLVFLAGPVAAPGVVTTAIGSVGLVWAAGRKTIASGTAVRDMPVWSIPSHSPIHDAMLESLAANGVSPRAISTCNNVRTLIELVRCGRGMALLPETMVRGDLAGGELIEVLPGPARQIRFEAAIRATERDPLVLELFRRAGQLQIDPASAQVDADRG